MLFRMSLLPRLPVYFVSRFRFKSTYFVRILGRREAYLLYSKSHVSGKLRLRRGGHFDVSKEVGIRYKLLQGLSWIFPGTLERILMS